MFASHLISQQSLRLAFCCLMESLSAGYRLHLVYSKIDWKLKIQRFSTQCGKSPLRFPFKPLTTRARTDAILLAVDWWCISACSTYLSLSKPAVRNFESSTRNPIGKARTEESFFLQISISTCVADKDSINMKWRHYSIMMMTQTIRNGENWRKYFEKLNKLNRNRQIELTINKI